LRKERRVELVVGIFLIVAVAIVMFMIVRMGGKLFVRQYEVTAYFSDAAGLNSGVSVTLAGVPVGEVNTLHLLSPNEVKRLGRTGTLVKVVLGIERKFNIPVDSRLVLTRTALLGEANLVFVATDTMEYLPKDGTAVVWRTELPLGTTEKLETLMEGLQKSFGSLVGNLNAFLGDEQFQRDLKSAVANLSEVADRSKGLADQTRESLKKMQELLSSIQKLVEGEQVKSMLDKADSVISSLDKGISAEKLEQTLTSVNNTAEEFGQLATQLNQILEKERGLLSTLLKDEQFAAQTREAVRGLHSSTRELEKVLPSLAAAAEQVRSLSDFLARHPSSVIFGRPKDAPPPYIPPPLPE